LALLDSLGTPFAGAYHTRLQVALRVARGEALLALRRVEEAEAVLREAVALYPSPESPAVQRLAAAYRARGAAARLAELRAAYPSLGAAAGAVGR
jgi:tetratricopeptide (TPR) repeat protein